MHLAATFSEHPLVAHAVGECVGDLMERVGESPDLLVVGLSERVGGASEDILSALGELLHPEVMLGVPSRALSVGSRSAAGGGGLGVLAAWHTHPAAGSGEAPVEPDWRVRTEGLARGVRISATRAEHRSGPRAHSSGPEKSLVGVESLAGLSGTLLLIVDPAGEEPTELASRIRLVAPDLKLVIGVPDCVVPRHGSALSLDGVASEGGAVGVHFPDLFPHRVVCSSGHVGIGSSLAVETGPETGGPTRLRSVDGTSAKEFLGSVLAGLAPGERASAAKGLYVKWMGLRGAEFDRFAKVLGTDGDAVVVAGEPPHGADAIRFQITDDEAWLQAVGVTARNNPDLRGGLVLATGGRPSGTPDGSRVPQQPISAAAGAVREAVNSTPSGVSDSGVVTATSSFWSETGGTEFLGIGCGEVWLSDTLGPLEATRGVTVVGMVE